MMTVLVAGAPALAQTRVAMVDCIIGGPCIGTSGNDTITGSEEQDEIYGLEGDDIIDPGNDSVTDYVYCGPGFDTVHQIPKVVSDEVCVRLDLDCAGVCDTTSKGVSPARFLALLEFSEPLGALRNC